MDVQTTKCRSKHVFTRLCKSLYFLFKLQNKNVVFAISQFVNHTHIKLGLRGIVQHL